MPITTDQKSIIVSGGRPRAGYGCVKPHTITAKSRSSIRYRSVVCLMLFNNFDGCGIDVIFNKKNVTEFRSPLRNKGPQGDRSRKGFSENITNPHYIMSYALQCPEKENTTQCYTSNSKRVDVSLDGNKSPPPMETRNTYGDTSKSRSVDDATKEDPCLTGRPQLYLPHLQNVA
uniref:SFRICE_035488 n=1 Tax=Spodoptera frugiperda TaxID=7108 RepID=A0A2H1WSU0_SPOFR